MDNKQAIKHLLDTYVDTPNYNYFVNSIGERGEKVYDELIEKILELCG